MFSDYGVIYSPSIITDETDKTMDVLERESKAVVQSPKMLRFFTKHGVLPVVSGVRDMWGAFPSNPTKRIHVIVLYVCIASDKFCGEVLAPLYQRVLDREEKKKQSNAPALD